MTLSTEGERKSPIPSPILYGSGTRTWWFLRRDAEASAVVAVIRNELGANRAERVADMPALAMPRTRLCITRHEDVGVSVRVHWRRGRWGPCRRQDPGHRHIQYTRNVYCKRPCKRTVPTYKWLDQNYRRIQRNTLLRTPNRRRPHSPCSHSGPRTSTQHRPGLNSSTPSSSSSSSPASSSSYTVSSSPASLSMPFSPGTQ